MIFIFLFVDTFFYRLSTNKLLRLLGNSNASEAIRSVTKTLIPINTIENQQF